LLVSNLKRTKKTRMLCGHLERTKNVVAGEQLKQEGTKFNFRRRSSARFRTEEHGEATV
jgi:hypothetical protein